MKTLKKGLRTAVGAPRDCSAGSRRHTPTPISTASRRNLRARAWGPETEIRFDWSRLRSYVGPLGERASACESEGSDSTAMAAKPLLSERDMSRDAVSGSTDEDAHERDSESGGAPASAHSLRYVESSRRRTRVCRVRRRPAARARTSSRSWLASSLNARTCRAASGPRLVAAAPALRPPRRRAGESGRVDTSAVRRRARRRRGLGQGHARHEGRRRDDASRAFLRVAAERLEPAGDLILALTQRRGDGQRVRCEVPRRGARRALRRRPLRAQRVRRLHPVDRRTASLSDPGRREAALSRSRDDPWSRAAIRRPSCGGTAAGSSAACSGRSRSGAFPSTSPPWSARCSTRWRARCRCTSDSPCGRSSFLRSPTACSTSSGRTARRSIRSSTTWRRRRSSAAGTARTSSRPR